MSLPAVRAFWRLDSELSIWDTQVSWTVILQSGATLLSWSPLNVLELFLPVSGIFTELLNVVFLSNTLIGLVLGNSEIYIVLNEFTFKDCRVIYYQIRSINPTPWTNRSQVPTVQKSRILSFLLWKTSRVEMRQKWPPERSDSFDWWSQEKGRASFGSIRFFLLILEKAHFSKACVPLELTNSRQRAVKSPSDKLGRLIIPTLLWSAPNTDSADQDFVFLCKSASPTAFEQAIIARVGCSSRRGTTILSLYLAYTHIIGLWSRNGLFWRRGGKKPHHVCDQNWVQDVVAEWSHWQMFDQGPLAQGIRSLVPQLKKRYVICFRLYTSDRPVFCTLGMNTYSGFFHLPLSSPCILRARFLLLYKIASVSDPSAWLLFPEDLHLRGMSVLKSFEGPITLSASRYQNIVMHNDDRRYLNRDSIALSPSCWTGNGFLSIIPVVSRDKTLWTGRPERKHVSVYCKLRSRKSVNVTLVVIRFA